MPNRKDGRIEKGQALATAISARAWNRAQQAADVVLGAQPGNGVGLQGGGQLPYTWIYCTNLTGADLGRWSVVELSPSAELQNIRNLQDGSPYPGRDRAVSLFEETPVIAGVTPSFSGYTQNQVSNVPAKAYPFGICVEPIGDRKLGRVAVSGLVQAKIYVPDGFPSFGSNFGMKVRSEYGDTTKLHADYDGTAEVIWSEETPDELKSQARFALIRLGVQQPPKLLQGMTAPLKSPNGDFFWRKDQSYVVDVFNPSRTVPAKALVVNRMAGFSVVPHKTINGIEYVPETLSPIGVTFAAIENEWRLVSIVSSMINY